MTIIMHGHEWHDILQLPWVCVQVKHSLVVQTHYVFQYPMLSHAALPYPDQSVLGLKLQGRLLVVIDDTEARRLATTELRKRETLEWALEGHSSRGTFAAPDHQRMNRPGFGSQRRRYCRPLSHHTYARASPSARTAKMGKPDQARFVCSNGKHMYSPWTRSACQGAGRQSPTRPQKALATDSYQSRIDTTHELLARKEPVRDELAGSKRACGHGA